MLIIVTVEFLSTLVQIDELSLLLFLEMHLCVHNWSLLLHKVDGEQPVPAEAP